MPPNSGTRWKPAIEEGDQAAADEVVREDADEERQHEHAEDAEARQRVAEQAAGASSSGNRPSMPLTMR